VTNHLLLHGGPEGDRTLDLTDANRTLSQAELRAQIFDFSTFLKGCNAITGKRVTGQRGSELEPNRVLSQLSYRPIKGTLKYYSISWENVKPFFFIKVKSDIDK
jgi:hypothetical protein